MVSFAGWSIEKAINYSDVFDIDYNDDGSITLTSKETFIHNEENGETKFEYKLILRGTDMGAFGCDNSIVFELLMMPLPKYWHTSIIREAASMFGWDNEPIEKLYDMFKASDAYDVGCTIQLIEDSIDYNPNNIHYGSYYYNILECVQAIKMMNVIASVSLDINNMRGFALDHSWNMLGNNGWDTLRHILCGGNLFAPAFARCFPIMNGETQQS